MKVIEGDILNIKNGVIVHQVNCQNAIGAGVSGAIIGKYPQVETAYHYLCRFKKPKDLLGSFQSIRIDRGLEIINLFTQLDYGNSKKTGKVYTDMPLLIKQLHTICHARKDKVTIYVPYGIGCGLAGGDWTEIEKGCADLDNLVAVKLEG